MAFARSSRPREENQAASFGFAVYEDRSSIFIGTSQSRLRLNVARLPASVPFLRGLTGLYKVSL